MYSTESPYFAASNSGFETLNNEDDKHPLIVTGDYPPGQIYADNGHHSGVVVTQPRAVVAGERIAPPDYLWLSCCSVCFCWPVALIAISKSRASARHAENGDYSKALESGKSARDIAVASILLGLIITVVLILTRFGMGSHCYPDC